MSLQRSVGPMTSSSVFFRALATIYTSRCCPLASRQISTSRQKHQSSKRDLYTTPAYRPYSLPDSIPPPPRNAEVPETSITGPRTSPEVNETRYPQIPGRNTRPSEEAASISLPESEAQKSWPVQQQPQHQAPEPSSPPAAPDTNASPPQRTKSKLKPRKSAITITAQALIHLRSLLSQPSPKMIRVGVKNRGCSGLAYHLEYVDKAGKFDEVVEQDGVKVLVDSKALFSIIGSEMDWQEDTLSARFVFRNPNIKEECGCGESFMV